MIYFDIRTGEWANKIDVDYLPQELYFEIRCSKDGIYHHEFLAEDGSVVEFDSKNDEEFNSKYKDLNDKHHFLCRKSWSVPVEMYQQGLKYFGIEDE